MNLTLTDAENAWERLHHTIPSLADLRTIITLAHHATVTLPEGPTQ